MEVEETVEAELEGEVVEAELQDALAPPAPEKLHPVWPLAVRERSPIRRAWPALRQAALLLVTALAAIAIDGYHPYAEDAGIYVAGIKQALDPGLYGSSSFFIAPYLKASVFSHLIAWLLRSLHTGLDCLLFTMQILTTWLLLYGCFELARRCFRRNHERWSAVLLAAACLSLPVAGSSLFIMDPYLTGRSFATPLTLLALCACLNERAGRTVLLLLLVALFHPLMAIYATGFVLLLWAVQRRSWTGAVALMLSALAAGAITQYCQRAVFESQAYRAAADSRDYFYLSRWHWYELFGLAAPLVLFAMYARWQGSGGNDRSRVLAKTCALLGVTSILSCLFFAREAAHSHLIAALQTIRPFLFLYLCMFLLLGGVIGHICGRERRWLFAALLLCTGAGLAFAQHRTYPASAQVELPGIASRNGWTRAFLWIRENTPRQAVFALDADYIHAPGEDAQGFRAIAERASLADASKDGGAAAVFPQLAERWMAEKTATTGLNAISDAERLRRLATFHVGWIVLSSAASTAMPCPFQNAAVKVCRLQ